MRLDQPSMGLLLNLLREHATRDTIEDFLRRRNQHYSAPNWHELIERRIRPAVKDGAISHEDLVELLRDSEEFGRQHVFFFEPKGKAEKSRLLMDRRRIEKELKRRDLEEILSKPRILDMPGRPQLVDARWESKGKGSCFVLKTVEKRVATTLLRTEEDADRLEPLVGKSDTGRVFARLYRTEEVRAVSVFRLHSFGLLEVRIFSHANSSKYQKELSRLFRLAGRLLPEDEFSEYPWSLTTAKNRLWKKRDSLAHEIRYSSFGLADNYQTKMKLSAGNPEATLFDAAAAVESVEHFITSGGAKLDQSSLWFLHSPDRAVPSKDIHVLLSGDINELAITGKCTRQDYEYVFKRIRQHN